MAITQFLHTSICISDPAKSVPFYRDILGFEVLDEQHYSGPGPSAVMDVDDADLTVWLMKHGPLRLELIHFARPSSAPLPSRPKTNSLGLSHLTVGVDDAEGTMAELKAKGVTVLDQTKGNFVDGRPGFQFLFEDPDGFLIETYTAPPDGSFPYG